MMECAFISELSLEGNWLVGEKPPCETQALETNLLLLDR